ncbi:Ig-like domain-containing protein [Microbacterium pumilum]|uniref:Ig-like domain-containing protein n=1 Tax=Microbacterium pumilum TaxID=344165 RepID=A0ABP5DLP6_9MICO
MRRPTVAGIWAAVVAVGLVIGVSVVWPGLDAQETPDVDTSVWALQTGEGRRYARVNTAVGELDTVRSISNPDKVVQAGDDVYLFSDSFSKVTRIDEARPVDLDDEALRASQSTPSGTIDVVTAGDFVAYRTDSGAVFAGLLDAGPAAQLDPFPSDDEDATQYTADAIAVDDRGILFSYSSADESVLRYDIRASEVRGRDPLAADDVAVPAITAAGDTWAVVDTEDGDVWLRGADAATPTPATAPIEVGEPHAAGSAVYLADRAGLVRVPVDGSGSENIVRPGADLGAPAQPIVHDGEVFAAWLGDDVGTLWHSNSTRTSELEYGAGSPQDDPRPAFVASDESIILNETRSGWAWTIPDGTLVPSSQDWTLDDQVNPDAEPSTEQLAVVIDPKPPIAESDAFGVRAGSLVSLPVLMNDHDPNEDVLSITPSSVTGLDPGFGTTSITDDGQRITVRVAPGATGSATFSYELSDGTASDGLRSNATTVDLTVAPDSVDSAPQWCGVERCLVPWPTPEVAPGGTVTVPVLPGWVDPEGDPLLLLSVDNPSGVGTVAATPGGEVVYQHNNDGDSGEELVELEVTISDTTGQVARKTLVVKVSPEPQLEVQSFAVVDTLDAGLSIDVAPHVTGTSGTMSLESARVLDDADATVTIVDGTTAFDFAASSQGTYRVDFTVTDGSSDATGTARITVLPSDAPPQLATAPVVAFVHPQEDATLDVFAVVSNPTRRVLLLSDVVGHAEDGAVLSVDAVGQRHLRVSGTTAAGGFGRLGTVSYVVSDGTADSGARVEGEATVYLLPPAPELAPIAVDDTVVVRAGDQIDIPVLDNDLSPAGGRPTLNPATVESSSPDALAFASGDLLRYLAPDEPGDYAIDYSVFTTGTPSLADTAMVRVRVLDDDANRAPAPETLEGRVLSGQSTTIEFDGFGMDPDGDVVTLDRIVTQPARGSATISADGTSIVYASVPGDHGQVSFRYRVADAFGAAGEGSVRIGVLDGEANPSPVTFTDYVQVQAGDTNTIRVSPLSNDVDPTRGTLRLTDVRPDVPRTLSDGSVSDEYTRLDDHIRSTDDTTIVIEAGDEPGTMSYLYDVESSSGNTGRGLIVVKVVRESVPDYPVVDDTVLTAETREDFPFGVDVVSDKATWSGGEVSELEVALWGDQDGVDVEGRELSGDLPSRTRIIPFAVTGEGSSGPVTTYAFLRIPGDDDLSLAMKSGIRPQEVTELQSVSFDLSDLVAKPRGSRIEVGDDVRASGAREEASCTVESGTVVRYDSGAGAPWVDACQVPVRLEGQDDWTYLSVPILVRALDPQPALRAGSMTVGPGETATFDLRNMTTWQLREDWEGIRYKVDYSGSAFDVSLDGSVVTVTGADRAVTGSEEAAIVSVTSHSAVAPVRLILRVGSAPSTLPQGGSLTQQCSQATGMSCSIPVIGALGEVNPLPRTPLEVIDVRPVGACTGVSFSVESSSSVLATWSEDAPGASCSATFSVRDAQGRRTNSERDGRLVLDLLGYPQAPASVSQTAYADRTLTLRVDPGPAGVAYPAISGFIIRWNAEVVAECAPDGSCPVIAAPNGEPRTYEAVAVNSVGESRALVRTVAWAYDPPPAPKSVTARPVVTEGEGGVIALSISGIDPDQTGSVEITSATGETVQVPVGAGQTNLEVPSYRVGTNTATPVTIKPLSRFEIPPGIGDGATVEAVTVTANGIGAPRDVTLALSSTSNGDGTSTVFARADAASGGDGSSLRFGIVREGARCTTVADGREATFTDLADGEEYRFTTCVDSWYDSTSFGRSMVTASVRAVQSGAPPTGWTFVVDSSPNVSDTHAEWVIRDNPTSSERLPNRNHAQFSGWSPGTTVFDRDPGMQVRYVHDAWGTSTPWAAVTPRAGSAPYQVQARWSVQSCVGGSDLALQQSSSKDPAGGSAQITFGNARLRFLDELGAELPATRGTWAVPVGAVRVEGITVSVDWSAQGWGLRPANATFAADCDPNLPIPTEPGEPQP